MRTLVTFLAGVVLASCGGGDKDEPAQPLEALAGAEYVIGYGETVQVGGGLSLEFTTLAEESRCPVNVLGGKRQDPDDLAESPWRRGLRAQHPSEKSDKRHSRFSLGDTPKTGTISGHCRSNGGSI